MTEARIIETQDISRPPAHLIEVIRAIGAATGYEDPEMPEAWLKAPEGRK